MEPVRAAEPSTEGIRRFREPRGIAALWFAVLAGPLAWMLGLNAEYSLVRVACAKDSMLYLHAVSLLTLLLALAGGWVAWREWKRSGGEWPGEEGGTIPRSRFMAALGLLASALFSLTILAQWVASFFLNPCMGI
jgi:nicotinamide riboside transporter PnuC